METTAIAKVETNTMPTLAPAPGEQVILNSDIIIPKLLLMQGLSEFVAEKKRCPISNEKIDTGNFVRSTTCEILGGEGKPVRFIPLKMVTNWILQEEINGKYEYRKTIPRTAANEMDPWEFMENGAKWRRVKTLDVFALLPQDIEAFQAEMGKLGENEMPDLNKTLLPVVISFRSTGFNAGKSVATFFAQVRDMQRYKPGIKSYGYTLELSTYQDKNDKGNYYVFKVGSPKQLDAKMLPEAERWFNTLAALRTVKIDESGDDAAGGAEQTMQF